MHEDRRKKTFSCIWLNLWHRERWQLLLSLRDRDSCVLTGDDTRHIPASSSSICSAAEMGCLWIQRGGRTWGSSLSGDSGDPACSPAPAPWQPCPAFHASLSEMFFLLFLCPEGDIDQCIDLLRDHDVISLNLSES